MAGIIGLLIALAIIGLIVWVIITLIPMPSQIRTIIVVVAALICLLIAYQALVGGGTLFHGLQLR